jgi:hypothetical protein
MLVEIIGDADHNPGHQQEKGEYFQVNVRIALKKYDQARQKSNCDEDNIKVSRHSRTK